jgi:endonuclease YncB( thermonuclease family)
VLDEAEIGHIRTSSINEPIRRIRRKARRNVRGAILSSPLKRAACALLIALSAAPAAARDLVGQVSVVDGDTLDIHDERIRLWGVDAPESSQLCSSRDRRPYRCGALSANTLDTFTRGKTLRCTPIDEDRYGRIVARCTFGKIDLGQMLVSRGLAVEEPQYSHGRYAADQLAARRAGRGIWAGRFVEPSFYRACLHAAGGRVAECSDGATGWR